MHTTVIRTIALFILSFAITIADARESYRDVAVIINMNSAVSESVGVYFAAQRLVPAQNVIRVNAPETEEITSAQFDQLRAQLEGYLTSHHMTDSINYLVTTKGMPLKVNRGGTTDYNSSSSSVESELCLILGPYASSIGKAGRCYSPYASMQRNFTRREFGFYLVTRLDGYTLEDVRAMIDRAASADSTVLETGRFVMDMDGVRAKTAGTLNGNMNAAAELLRAKNRLALLDTTTQFLRGLPDVLAYVSWGSNDPNANAYTDHAKPYHQFLPGSIAETYVSTSGRSFAPGTAYGQSLVADLVAEGVCGAKAYVYEPYSSAMADVHYTFPMYAEGFTLAESFYAGSYYLSWMDVVIGDPKMRIRTVRIPQSMQLADPAAAQGALPVELVSFTGMQAGSSVRLAWTTAIEVDNYGFEVEVLSAGSWRTIGFVQGSGTSNVKHAYSFLDKNPSTGACTYRLKQIDRDGRFEYLREATVLVAPRATEFKLNANYPNPFNPTTSISFTLAQTAHAELKVYNMIGQVVAMLFSGEAEAGVLMTVSFDASALSSGVYFSVLESAGTKSVQKMILSK